MTTDASERFSNRVEDYIRYRPSYPPGVLAYIRDRLGVSPGATVADVGSGTGIFSALLLDAGYCVVAIEPNTPMRGAAERMLSGRDGFASISATAEATTLADASVDLVVAAQAFHWFDVERARRELRRILVPGGAAMLVWNDRREETTPFASEYQALIDEYNTDLAAVDHRRVTREKADAIGRFFGGAYDEASFDNAQELDLEGLRGRLVSSSYIPAPGAPGHDEMLAALATLFERHAVDGRVRIEYATKVYAGVMGGAA